MSKRNASLSRQLMVMQYLSRLARVTGRLMVKREREKI